MPFDTETGHASPTGATLRLTSSMRRDAPRRHPGQSRAGRARRRYARFAEFMSAPASMSTRTTIAAMAPRPRPMRRRGVRQPDGAAKVIADVAAIHDLIAGEHPGLPVIVFGHSMGGLIALNFVLRHSARVQAAAIWNANFSAGLLGRVAQAILAYERFRLGSDMPSRMLPKLTFQAWAKQIPDRRTEFDWLSRDPAEVDKYVADPLCGWDASVSMWRDVFRFVFFGADDRNFGSVRKDLPFNLVGGEKDPATDGGKAVQELAERMAANGLFACDDAGLRRNPARNR